MSTPDLHLQTLFVLDGNGRITSTREPGAPRGPLFCLVRDATQCIWAIRADLPDDVARELDALARDEPPVVDLRDAPAHADQYRSVLRGRGKVASGPAFAFPDHLTHPANIALIQDEARLQRHFRGWVPGEIAAGRAPVTAILVEGDPVSVCFCARRADGAAEAGVETAVAYRGRGLASVVITAWALAVREAGRIPLYSTAWTNQASLAVARKLGLIAYASDWSLTD